MKKNVHNSVQNNKRNQKTSLMELFSLAFLIHFFGALFYSAFLASNHQNPAQWWSVWYLHLWLGGISILSIGITILLEYLYKKKKSIIVAKWLFRSWVFGMCILIGWAWIQ